MLQDIPYKVQQGASQLISKDGRTQLHDFRFSAGGCINRGGKLSTSLGDFFVKWNDASRFPGMFEAEARGLELLRNANAVHVPSVIGTGDDGNFQFLVLEFVSERTPTKNYWEQLGYQVSLLHRAGGDSFGLDHDNYIGSLRQINTQDNSWVDFFIERRLNEQLRLAIDAGLIDPIWVKKFETFYARLPSLIPGEMPSLLHGDLWSGNVMVNEKGHPSLIDPAVYYGSREADLAMTGLFGGFGPEFYASYQDGFPLLSGYPERIDIYNLYPLLVHLNLFGVAYLSRIKAIVMNFVQ